MEADTLPCGAPACRIVTRMEESGLPRESPQNRADEAALTLLAQLPGLAALHEGPDLRITAMSASAKALVGDLTGRTIPEAKPELVGQQVLERIREVYETGEAFTGDEWRVHVSDADGQMQELYVNIVANPVRWSDGSMRGVVVEATPVTDTVRAWRQDAARSAELRKRARAAQETLLTLQDELLPDSIPVLPRVEVAASYLLADADSSAGGDWFDVIPLPGGHLALVVGDVVGHGVGASAVMGRLRAVLEERLVTGADLLDALAALDSFASRDQEAHAATVCVVDLDLDSGAMRYCTAGHPPPIVVTESGEASYLPRSGAGALVSGRPFAAAEHVLDEGELVLLYSDGIVERPGRSIPQNTLDLLGAAADAVAGRGFTIGVAEHAVDRITQHPLEVLTRMSGFADDITLVAARRRPPPEPLELNLPALPESLRTALTGLMDWLERQRVQSNDMMAVAHAVGELVSNVIDHAYRDRGTDPEREVFTLTATLTEEGAGRIEIADGGAWREPDRSGDRGRGLAMAGGLVDTLEIDRTPAGTTARIIHRLRRHVELLTDVSGAHVPGPSRAGDFGCEVGEGLLRVSGPVDRASVDSFRSAFGRASSGGTQPVVVDLDAVTHLASCGVQALVEALAPASPSRGAAAGIRLLAPVGSPAQHVLELVGLPYLTELRPGD